MLTLDQIQAAQQRLVGVSQPTPLLPDDTLSRELGCVAYVKAECLQKAGSFKLRGAYNRMAQLTPAERRRGVVAASAGNHAQGVALAARLLGIQATLVMPTFAPLTKVTATRALGAQAVLHGLSFDDAVAHALQLEQQQGLTPIPAFNDYQVMAGQGTIGLEILHDLPQVSVLVVPIGGGGLMAGIATALKALKPGVKLYGVQAEGCSAVRPSLAAGHPVAVTAAQTIADGIAVKRPGDLTLPILGALLEGVVEVSDDEIARGIAHCAQNLKLVVEGAGAAGMAALLAGKIPLGPEDTVATVLCGGNIDGNLLSRVIEQVMVRQGRYLLLRLAVIDRPGTLSSVINLVAAAQANIIDIFHRRALWLAPLGKVGVELVLEVRDQLHGQQVVAALEKAGYPVEPEGREPWPG